MWIAIVAVAVGSVVTAVVGRRGAAGDLPRNNLAGVRTPATLADDASWYAAQRVASAWVVGGGVAGAVCSAAAAFAALTDASESAVLAWVLGAAGVLAVAALVGCVRGARAARATAAGGSGAE